jgi:hypothetical protein
VSTHEFLKFGVECKEIDAKKARLTLRPVILSGVLCREGSAHSVDSTDAADGSIDPFDKLRASSSARKERGLQDDKPGKIALATAQFGGGVESRGCLLSTEDFDGRATTHQK